MTVKSIVTMGLASSHIWVSLFTIDMLVNYEQTVS